MKIYTRTGDQGKTSLIGGTRVSKGHHRIEAYGTVDELNSHIGIVHSFLKKSDPQWKLIEEIQNDLFVMGSTLAADPEKSRMELPELESGDVSKLEDAIDAMNEDLEPLKAFILPGGHLSVAQCHVARCVCRRAERCVVVLQEQEVANALLLEYLNRLSDYLFVLARKIGKDFDVQEVAWQPRK